MPAGDIGVGGREIGFMFGQYKRIRNEFVGVLTGKGLNWGGSLIRPEATGYGAVYFAAEMLATRGETLEGKTCLVSGSGNVAQYAIEKILDLGGKAVTLSDSGGYIYDEAGIDREKLAFVLELKNVKRGRIKEYADKFPGAVYTPVDTAKASTRCGTTRPTAPSPAPRRTRSTPRTRRTCSSNGVLRGLRRRQHADRPRGRRALRRRRSILYGPGKAANAGGVATSGLEMSQNSLRLSWTREEVDARLHGIMKAIHKQCVDAAARLRHARATTWPAPTSPASSRSPTRCSTRASSDRLSSQAPLSRGGPAGRALWSARSRRRRGRSAVASNRQLDRTRGTLGKLGAATGRVSRRFAGGRSERLRGIARPGSRKGAAAMKKIECFIQPYDLDTVAEALAVEGVRRHEVTEVKGFGVQKGFTRGEEVPGRRSTASTPR